MGATLPDHEQLRKLQTIDADTEQTNALIDELLLMGTRRFQFSGNGEVFILKDGLEFMARAKHPGSFCVANTNGTLLEKDVLDALIKMGFDELRITTMAGSSDVYERTHQGIKKGTFEKLTNNLIYLAERKAALKATRPRVVLVFIVVAHNCDSLIRFAEFAAQVQASGVLYKPVDDLHDPYLSPLVLSLEQTESVRQQLLEARAFLESRKIDHNINRFFSAFQQKLDTSELYSIIPCFYGWLTVMIEADGTVYPCCRCYKTLGNTYDSAFADIWNSIAYRDFRKEAIELNRRKSPVRNCECYNCPHHAANLRVYQSLHPLRGRSARFRQLTGAAFVDEE